MSSWYLRGGPKDLPKNKTYSGKEGKRGYALGEYGDIEGDGHGNPDSEVDSAPDGEGFGNTK
jgi:hypothetical protein